MNEWRQGEANGGLNNEAYRLNIILRPDYYG